MRSNLNMPSSISTNLPAHELTALAAEAFIYGYPLVYNLDHINQFVRGGVGAVPGAAFNEFGHAHQLAGPETKFVSINNDTVYSNAMVDVSGGPVRLDVPDAAGRYYVMQFVDAWTNNFAYVGHRSTGTTAGSYLLVPPGWTGHTPDGVTVIRFPTAIASIVGRWAVAGEDDLPTVAALQAGLRLTPSAPGAGLPPPAKVPDSLAFFEKLRVGIAAFPPAPRDRAYQQRFAPLGLLEPGSPYTAAEPGLADALPAGLAAGQSELEKILIHSPAPQQNGWNLTYHIFDYNLDFFEVGALDDSFWKLADNEVRYVHRAGAARGGLWGNHGYEAAYAMVYQDSDGQTLDGAHCYELRLSTPPPCGAFWSVTMYGTPDFYLVANPLHRYSIGDRTPGLTWGADGSLTITIQHDEPSDPQRRANWLPAPAGGFRPLMRIYEPRPEVFDSYQLPPIVRLP